MSNDGKKSSEVFRSLKEQLPKLQEKVSSLERERASLEGQRKSILERVGVSSLEELEQAFKTTVEEFDKQVAEFSEKFESVAKIVQEIEDARRDLTV